MVPVPDADPPDHAAIARDLIHLRSAVGSPAVSPDGAHVAAVVATVDLDENTTNTRIWLDGVPLTAGPKDTQPVWSPDGRQLAFTGRRDGSKDTTLEGSLIGWAIKISGSELKIISPPTTAPTQPSLKLLR